MKRLTFNIVILMLLQSLLSMAQEQKESVFSISIGSGFYSFFSSNTHSYYLDENHSQKQSVMNINGDIGLWLDRYIFSLYFSSGLGGVNANNGINYSEYNLTVGMEFLRKDWFALEGHLGIGYFQVEEQYFLDGEIDQWGTIGFPFRVKANAYLSKHFAIGINPNVNINFDTGYSIIAINLIAQFRF